MKEDPEVVCSCRRCKLAREQEPIPCTGNRVLDFISLVAKTAKKKGGVGEDPKK